MEGIILATSSDRGKNPVVGPENKVKQGAASLTKNAKKRLRHPLPQEGGSDDGVKKEATIG